MPSKLTNTTTDHDTIRRWAEERGGQPAEVMGTERGGGTGMIRIDFPGYSGAGKLKPIGWDEWFQKFDDSGLALIFQEKTSGGQRSNFNKLIARETAEARAEGVPHASRRRLRAGQGAGSRRHAGRARRSASSGRPAARGRGAGSRAASRRSATGRRSASARGGARREQGSREAPSAVAARLTGRGRAPGAEGGRSRTSSRTSRSAGGRSRAGGKTSSRKGATRRTSRAGGRGRRR